MYLVIEIVLLATYSNALTINSDYDAYRGLSLTGSVFMMLGFLVMIGLHFKYIEYAIYGLLALMSFGVFLLLIGMGMVSSYVIIQLNYYRKKILISMNQLDYGSFKLVF